MAAQERSHYPCGHSWFPHHIDPSEYLALDDPDRAPLTLFEAIDCMAISPGTPAEQECATCKERLEQELWVKVKRMRTAARAGTGHPPKTDVQEGKGSPPQ